MDNGLFTACVLLGTLVAGLLYYFVMSRLPSVVKPYAELPEAEQRRVTQQKFFLRCAALAFFALAVLLLFTGMPRGSTVLTVALGFLCQYNVFRLRRKYPVRPPHLMQSGNTPSSKPDAD